MLVSDASGQMAAIDEPGAGRLGVVLRSFSVSMARVRQAEFRELDARRRSSILRGLMFLHMKKDLDVDPVDWVDCQDPYDASDDARPLDRRGILTRFGIRKDMQYLLAGIRTDLDSFTEIEAYSLMTSGYRMAQFDFKRSIEGLFPAAELTNTPWKFLEVESLLSQGPQFAEVKKQLTVGASAAFKVWRLIPPLTVAGVVLIMVLAGALVWAGWHWRAVSLLTVGGIGTFVLATVAALVIPTILIRIIRFRGTLRQASMVSVATLIACIGFKLHLLLFDPLFLKIGQLARFQKKPEEAPAS
jgi:hypothetical protein